MSNDPAGGTRQQPPRIGVYAGRASSHSWLWLADLFDHVVPLDEKTFASGLEKLDVVCISGGDTFGLAEHLGERGAERLDRFVRDGGTYVGICAGACLCLRSSRPPLSWFNFTEGTIGNIAPEAPEPLWQNLKYSCSYGACEVFHPVRGEVELVTHEGDRFTAPLYGGPAILPGTGMSVLAKFDGFCEGTGFITDEATARSTYLGRAAVVEQPMGRGRLLLCSPHLEHPGYGKANRSLVQLITGPATVPEKSRARSHTQIPLPRTHPRTHPQIHPMKRPVDSIALRNARKQPEDRLFWLAAARRMVARGSKALRRRETGLLRPLLLVEGRSDPGCRPSGSPRQPGHGDGSGAHLLSALREEGGSGTRKAARDPRQPEGALCRRGGHRARGRG